MDGKRKPGGEWDTLRATPLRVRRSLTSAGYLSRHGMQPDDFADLLTRNGVTDPDPIAWYVREARRALRERQQARRVGLDLARAHAAGCSTPFQHRDQQARALGYDSFWYYRRRGLG